MDSEGEAIAHLRTLSLSDPSTSGNTQVVASHNPWTEVQSAGSQVRVKSTEQAAEDIRESNTKDVETDLKEFDPLVKPTTSQEDSDHPEPQSKVVNARSTNSSPSSSSETKQPTSADAASPLNSPGIASGFSFANIARSLSISKTRASSVDKTHAFVAPDDIRQSAGPSEQRSQPKEDHSNPAISADEHQASDGDSRQSRVEPPPFDFQLFLDQMKTRSAEPVAKYLRSFLGNFAKRTLTVNDQIKVINDFLNFIALRMREADVWKNASDVEFDNALESMEKLVMNRLYEFTFTPQVAEAVPPRPVTTDDLERDRILAQRIALYGWVEEKHLEVPDPTDGGGFLMFAQQELLKINHYKAPRDKLICILNTCKVIFGLIRNLHKEENADTFVPILIFVVLKSNPPNLISNIEYIQRFRNPQKLQSEAGYYLSSLMGAVHFIETMDHTGLTNITAEEFERNVEFAIQDLPSSPMPASPSLSLPSRSNPSSRPTTPSRPTRPALSTPAAPSRPNSGLDPPMSPHAGEESAQPLALSLGGLGAGASGIADDTKRFFQRTQDAIGKPLSALGRFLGEALDDLGTSPTNAGTSGAQGQGQGQPPTTPYKPRIRQNASARRRTAQSEGSPEYEYFGTGTQESQGYLTPSRIGPGGQAGMHFGSPIPSHMNEEAGLGISRTPTPALDLAGVQEEINLAHARASDANLGTLMQIFPGVDREIVEWVLEAEGNDLGRSIEKLLEVGSGS